MRSDSFPRVVHNWGSGLGERSLVPRRWGFMQRGRMAKDEEVEFLRTPRVTILVSASVLRVRRILTGD